MIKLSDYVMNFLYEISVKHIFMLPGGGCMHLVDSLGKQSKIQYICSLHEQACTISAEAYAQYRNELGVVIVTTGPGATNAITGVAGAWVDSTPVLVISGQAKRGTLIENSGLRQLGVQEVDIIPMVRPITKYAVSVQDPNNIKYYLEKAVSLATTGRKGPVWLEIPVDVQCAMINPEELQGYHIDNENENSTLNIDNEVLQIIEMINSSQRPCLFVGNGVKLSSAEKELYTLAEMLKIPVLTTWKAMDLFDENYKYYYGRPGIMGRRGPNFIQQNCDFLLILGSKLGVQHTAYNYDNFAKFAKKVMVDIDKEEINKMNNKIDLGVVCDSKTFINTLIKFSEKINQKDRNKWFEYCEKMKNKYPAIEKRYLNQENYVNSFVLAKCISDTLGNEDILTPGSSGGGIEAVIFAHDIKQGQKVVFNQGLGAMGFDIPASIGACIASGMKRTVCITGDGGFQMNIQELQTVKRLDLPIKFFVLNNQGYSTIRNSQKNNFGRFVACDENSGMSLPDICKVADAYGIKVEKISHNEEISSKLQDILNYNGPVVCEVMQDPYQEAPPHTASLKMSDGTMISKPMEDLYPFLDRNEFNSNMIALVSK